jgi:WW domain
VRAHLRAREAAVRGKVLLVLHPADAHGCLVQDLVNGFRSCVWVPLPDGWSEHFDPKTGQPYYVDAVTGAKQWERPEFAVAMVHSSVASTRQPGYMRVQPQRRRSLGGHEAKHQ